MEPTEPALTALHPPGGNSRRRRSPDRPWLGSPANYRKPGSVPLELQRRARNLEEFNTQSVQTQENIVQSKHWNPSLIIQECRASRVEISSFSEKPWPCCSAWAAAREAQRGSARLSDRDLAKAGRPAGLSSRSRQAGVTELAVSPGLSLVQRPCAVPELGRGH